MENSEEILKKVVEEYGLKVSKKTIDKINKILFSEDFNLSDIFISLELEENRIIYQKGDKVVSSNYQEKTLVLLAYLDSLFITKKDEVEYAIFDHLFVKNYFEKSNKVGLPEPFEVINGYQDKFPHLSNYISKIVKFYFEHLNDAAINNCTPKFETERLVVRPPRNIDELMEIDSNTTFLPYNHNCFYFVFTLKGNKEPIGYFGVRNEGLLALGNLFSDKDYGVEGEYYIKKEYRNHGYAYEALSGIIEAFKDFDILEKTYDEDDCYIKFKEGSGTPIKKNKSHASITSITLTIDYENTPSIKLAKKLAFKEVGKLGNYDIYYLNLLEEDDVFNQFIDSLIGTSDD